MKSFKLCLTLMLAFVVAFQMATAQEENSDKKVKKKIIIIEKTTEDGQEKVETITKEGDDIDIKITIDGEEVDIDDLEAEDVEVIELTGDKLESLILKGLEEEDYDFDFDFDVDVDVDVDADRDKGYLGVMLEVKKEKEAGENAAEAIVITEVFKNSSAEKAGLKAGDIVTAINDEKVTGLRQLVKAIGRHKAGEQITIDYIRNGQQVEAKATLKKRDKQKWGHHKNKELHKEHALRLLENDSFKIETDRGYLGVILGDATANGVAIVEVEAESAAKAAGLQVGDVITAINGKKVKTVETLVDAIKVHKAKETIQISYTRNEVANTVAATLKETKHSMFFFNNKGNGFNWWDSDNFEWLGNGNMLNCDATKNNVRLGVILEGANEQGVIVESVMEESAAKAAGLQKGDIITTIGDKMVKTTDELVKAVKSHKAGETIQVGYLRDGKSQVVEATLKEATPRNAFLYEGKSKPRWVKMTKGEKHGFMGVYIADDEVTKGVELSGIVKASGAEKAGLQKGDKITKINDKTVDTHKALTDVLGETKPDELIEVTYERDGETQTTQLTLGQHKKMRLKIKKHKHLKALKDRVGKIRKKIVIIQKENKDEPEEQESETDNLSSSSSSRLLELSKLELYPNPNSGAFTIDFEANDLVPTTITVVNLSGKEVYREELKDFTGAYNKRINIANHASGIYFLNIIQGDKKVTKKLIYNQ